MHDLFKGLGSLAAFLAGVLILIYVLTIHLPGVINAKVWCFIQH